MVARQWASPPFDIRCDHLAVPRHPSPRHPDTSGHPGNIFARPHGVQGLVAQQRASTQGGAVALFKSMMEKSLVGYGITFLLGLIIFAVVLWAFEKKIKAENEAAGENGKKELHPNWMIFQWCSTGFLWSMWLVQDLANIFVYLPQALFYGIALALGSMVLMQGYIFERAVRSRVVRSKTNTLDVRSATFIDVFYGLVPLFFKVDYIPQLFTMMGMDVPWPEKDANEHRGYSSDCSPDAKSALPCARHRGKAGIESRIRRRGQRNLPRLGNPR